MSIAQRLSGKLLPGDQQFRKFLLVISHLYPKRIDVDLNSKISKALLYVSASAEIRSHGGRPEATVHYPPPRYLPAKTSKQLQV